MNLNPVFLLYWMLIISKPPSIIPDWYRSPSINNSFTHYQSPSPNSALFQKIFSVGLYEGKKGAQGMTIKLLGT